MTALNLRKIPKRRTWWKQHRQLRGNHALGPLQGGDATQTMHTHAHPKPQLGLTPATCSYSLSPLTQLSLRISQQPSQQAHRQLTAEFSQFILGFRV